MVAMPDLFLSYSTRDQFFAELVELKLKESNIGIWRDQAQLQPGENWRSGIDDAIDRSLAVLIVMSESSVLSAYVTYEWAYALGRRKVIIPLRLDSCTPHPRLSVVQYLDFSVPSARPWSTIVERLRSIETASDPGRSSASTPTIALPSSPEEKITSDILKYLDERGFQMASFERLREVLGNELSNEKFTEIIDKNPSIFRSAKIKGGRPGLAKLVP
jgi:hypothetical protein